MRWMFPALSEGGAEGFSNAGLEMFKGDVIKALAREVCQNSLDNFSSSSVIMQGILDALKELSDHKVVLVVKKHLRPALKYLNAYGGSILLDSLDSDEIKRILLKKLLELKYGNDELIDYSGDDYTDEPADDDEDEDSLYTDDSSDEIPKELLKYLNEKTETVIKVDYLDIVRVIRVKDYSEMPLYDIPGDKEAVSKAKVKIIPELMGRKLNEKFRFNNEVYQITEIIKRPPSVEIWD
ncbi:MAG: hypothetical protein E7298_06325 [Lachnospiraceae bacterium]|nr:hypothetical protein [Lachnospiraceae bacterium]